MSTEAVPSSGQAPETAPPPAETTTLPPSSPQMATPALSLGAIVGIVVAAAALFIAGAILFIVYWMRQERYKAEDERRYHPYLLRGASSMTTTHPHYTDDHKRRPSSILTAGWQAQSDELDRVMNMPRRPRSQLEATHAGTSISSISGLPTHPAYIPRSAGLPGSNLRSMSSQASRSQRQTPSLNMTEKSQPAPVNESQHSPVLSDARTSIDSAEQPFSPLSKATTQRLSQRKTRTVDLPLRHVEPVQPAPVLAPRTSPHSYAMQQYLESTDDLPAQQPTRARAALPPLDPKNLPPPPRHPPPAKVPSLALPSKPRLRAPLQYAPPRITGSSSPPGPPAVDSGYGDITISGPLVDMVTVDLSERRHRVSGLSHGHGQASRGLAPRSHIVAQTAHRHDDNEMPLHSGKSFLYG